MGENTTVSWCDISHNFYWGCQKVAPECKYCYAETDALRYGKNVFGPAGTTSRWLLSEEAWKKPYRWNEKARKAGKRLKVFCSSMSDVFEDNPALIESQQRAFKVFEDTEWLNWQVLTKRPQNILRMIPSSWNGAMPDHVSIGTSAGTQDTAIKNIPELIKIKATVHFVSCEPMLEHVDFTPWLPQLQWIICGGESGIKHRPFQAKWAEALRLECQEHNVPFFFKQVGGRFHNSGGDLLYGQEYKAFPAAYNRIPQQPRL